MFAPRPQTGFPFQYVELIWRATNSGMLPSRQRIYPDGVIHDSGTSYFQCHSNA
jgi:hypothetical protein